MLGLDDSIADLSGGGPWLAVAVAFLLGLRHATDPDHLTAVSTLMLSHADARSQARRAGMLGVSWGLGHAVTLLLFGLPAVLFRDRLPGVVGQAAEIAVGMIIVLLALRLLLRWRRGYFHVHTHTHDGVPHAHPHMHEGRDHAGGHDHRHGDALGRSPAASFGIGLVHGVGGSAGVGVLLVGTATGKAGAAVALAVFAAGTALCMALVSSAFAHALARTAALHRIAHAVPALGVTSLLFGVWYALGATSGAGVG